MIGKLLLICCRYNITMKKTNYAVAAGLLLLFSACSKVYTPALYHQDIAYMPKPASFDERHTANYVSAGFDIHSDPNLSDAVVSGQLNLSRAHTFDNVNIAYGAFTAFGDYQNGSDDRNEANYFKDKSFGVVGGRFSANLYTNNDRLDFRFIGVEAAYSHEFGDYATYRQSLAQQSGYFVDPRTNLLSVGLTTEVIFHNRNNKLLQHAIRGYLGTTFGYNPVNETFYTDDTATERMFRNIYPRASYAMMFKNYFGIIEVGSAFSLRFGVKF